MKWNKRVGVTVLAFLLIVGGLFAFTSCWGSSESKPAGVTATGAAPGQAAVRPVSQEGVSSAQGGQGQTAPVQAAAIPAAAKERVNIGTGVEPTPSRPLVRPPEDSEFEHEMAPGETFKAKAGSMIKGDVSVGGVRYFDDNENTGLIIELDKDADIFAPYGANVTFVGFEPAVRNAIFGQAVEEMKKKGCMPGRGCIEGVTTIPVPGGTPQGTSGGK